MEREKQSPGLRVACERQEGSFEMIKKIEVERFSLTSSKPFDQVVAALNAAIGHPDMAEFGKSTHEACSFAELKSAVEKGLSKTGLMLFMQLDQGAVVQKATGQDTPRIIRLLIGNPLIMKERMASFLVAYGNPDALRVAEDLDNKVETLLREAAA